MLCVRKAYQGDPLVDFNFISLDNTYFLFPQWTVRLFRNLAQKYHPCFIKSKTGVVSNKLF